MSFVAGLLVGVVAGTLVALVVLAQRRSRRDAGMHRTEALLSESRQALERSSATTGQLQERLVAAEREQARLEAEVAFERQAGELRRTAWEEDRARLEGSFAELSRRALQHNAEAFLELADQRMKQAQVAAQGDLVQRQQAIAQVLEPFKETLTKYEGGLRQLELDRKGAYEALTERIGQLGQSQEQLQRETRNLVSALRSPQTRGRWGEVQLRRVVELAGMLVHCDFDEQVGVIGETGRLRPDMVVHMPGGGEVIVDAKVPLEAFLRAVEAEDETVHRTELALHARQLRTHVDDIAKKEYWKHVDGSAEQVVVFVPGDALLAAAYDQDPRLQEHAMTSGVLLATPTTLIALLRTIALGWRQERLAENARRVQELGTELYERLRRMGQHLAKMQRSLTATVESFNQTVGSFESRVMVTARKFPELGAATETEELALLEPVEATVRFPNVPEVNQRQMPPVHLVADTSEEPGLPPVESLPG